MRFAYPGEADDVDEHDDGVLGAVEAGGSVAQREALDHGRGEVAREVRLLALEAAAATAFVTQPQHLRRRGRRGGSRLLGGSAASQIRSSDKGELEGRGEAAQQEQQDA